MGDSYQTIVDLEADIDAAGILGSRVRDWMVAQQVIVPQETDCAMSRRFPGHAPGANYILAASEAYPNLFNLRTNGVVFIAERSVFYSDGVGDTFLICSVCGRRFPHNDAWSAAIENWYVACGSGMLTCAHCGAEAPITEWRHEPPWAFANFGIEFWNWPRLREEFLNKVSEVLEHRVRLVFGRW
jgi:hypothetical protein